MYIQSMYHQFFWNIVNRKLKSNFPKIYKICQCGIFSSLLFHQLQIHHKSGILPTSLYYIGHCCNYFSFLKAICNIFWQLKVFISYFTPIFGTLYSNSLPRYIYKLCTPCWTLFFPKIEKLVFLVSLFEKINEWIN